MAACDRCGVKLKLGKMRCTSCGLWCIPRGLETSGFVRLSDVKEPPVARLVTGLCDAVFGGGVVTTTINLLGGSPGAGKSTVCLQLASKCIKALDKVRDDKPDILYVGVEQSNGELKGYASRLGLEDTDRLLVPESIEQAQAMLSGNLGDSFRKKPPGFGILDSISRLCSGDHGAAVTVCQGLKLMATELKMPWFIISHINKENDFAGLMALQHEVDSVSTIFKLDNKMRQWTMWKNRWGQETEQFYQMTEKGLVFDEEYTKAQSGEGLEEDIG